MKPSSLTTRAHNSFGIKISIFLHPQWNFAVDIDSINSVCDGQLDVAFTFSACFRYYNHLYRSTELQ